MLPWAAFFALAATMAIIASLERILGRPVPRLRYSRAVSKNRLFWAVPVLMGAIVVWLLPRALSMASCSHCSEPYVWKHSQGVASVSMLVFGVSGAAGWIVYYSLLLSVSITRLFLRPSRNTTGPDTQTE
jgi:hypothetical protein